MDRREDLPWFNKGKIAVLVLCSIAYSCMSVSFGAVRALQLALKTDLNIDETEVGFMFAIYELPSVIMVLWGGILIDRFGLSVCVVIFSGFCLAGFALQTLGVFLSSFPLLVAGRFLAGCGGETLFVTWDGFLTLWHGSSVALAMSVYCGFGRLGDVFTSLALPPLVTLLGSSTATMMLTLGLTTIAFVACIGLAWLESKAPKEKTTNAASSSDSSNVTANSSLKDRLKSFGWGYWVAVAVAIALYSTINLLTNFIPEVIFSRHLLDKTTSSMALALSYGIAFVITPLYGWFLTSRLALRFQSVLVASVLLFLSCVFLVPSDSLPLAIVSLVSLGIGFAFTSSALWGTIGMYGSPATVGLVYCIPYACYNLVGFLTALATGALLEHASVSLTVWLWVGWTAMGVAVCGVWVWSGRVAPAASFDSFTNSSSSLDDSTTELDVKNAFNSINMSLDDDDDVVSDRDDVSLVSK